MGKAAPMALKDADQGKVQWAKAFETKTKALNIEIEPIQESHNIRTLNGMSYPIRPTAPWRYDPRADRPRRKSTTRIPSEKLVHQMNTPPPTP